MTPHNQSPHDGTVPRSYQHAARARLLSTAPSPSAPRQRTRWAATLWFASSVFVAAACTHRPNDSENDDAWATGMADTQGDETTVSVSGAPIIEQLTLAPSVLTPWDDVIVTAVVSDPDGPDDIKAGLIFHDSTGGVYRGFAEVEVGVYEAEITWSTLNGADSIEFASGDRRRFSAEFFDHSGHVAGVTFDLQLDCGGLAACDGVCTDLNEPDHCGQCGVECDHACVDGQCAAAK